MSLNQPADLPASHRAPAGHSVRAASLADVRTILSLIIACDVDVIGHPDYTAEDVEADLGWPGLVPERDTVLVFDERQPGDPVAVGWAWCHDDGGGKPDADFYVGPGADDPVGPWVVGWVERRAAGVAHEAGLDRTPVSVGNWSTDHRRAAWLERAGWAKVRTFYRMVIDLPEAASEAPSEVLPGDGARDPGVPEPPAGVVVRVVGDDEAGRRSVHLCDSESFRDHWDSTERTYDAWLARRLAAAGSDPTMWWLVEVDGVPAASLVGTAQMAADSTGWISNLGVRREFRGRGLAKLLLRIAFAEFARRGWRHAELAVDTENPTGALRLYKAVGMREKYAIDAWRLEVAAAPSANRG